MIPGYPELRAEVSSVRPIHHACGGFSRRTKSTWDMLTDPQCVFCKIVAGGIPAEVVFRDAHCLAFLDINPLAPGHLLLIPAQHYPDLPSMPADLVGRVLSRLPLLGQALCGTAGVEAFNVLQNNGRSAGQVVMHAHFHLIPRRAADGLGYRWNAGEYAPGQASDLAKRFREALSV